MEGEVGAVGGSNQSRSPLSNSTRSWIVIMLKQWTLTELHAAARLHIELLLSVSYLGLKDYRACFGLLDSGWVLCLLAYLLSDSPAPSSSICGKLCDLIPAFGIISRCLFGGDLVRFILSQATRVISQSYLSITWQQSVDRIALNSLVWSIKSRTVSQNPSTSLARPILFCAGWTWWAHEE